MAGKRGAPAGNKNAAGHGGRSAGQKAWTKAYTGGMPSVVKKAYNLESSMVKKLGKYGAAENKTFNSAVKTRSAYSTAFAKKNGAYPR